MQLEWMMFTHVSVPIRQRILRQWSAANTIDGDYLAEFPFRI